MTRRALPRTEALEGEHQMDPVTVATAASANMALPQRQLWPCYACGVDYRGPGGNPVESICVLWPPVVGWSTLENTVFVIEVGEQAAGARKDRDAVR